MIYSYMSETECSKSGNRRSIQHPFSDFFTSFSRSRSYWISEKVGSYSRSLSGKFISVSHTNLHIIMISKSGTSNKKYTYINNYKARGSTLSTSINTNAIITTSLTI